jgi:hypothetical protein
MRLELPTPDEARSILRGFVAVASAEGSVSALGAQERAMIQAASSVLGANVDVDSLMPITPEELSKNLQRPSIRSQVIQGMVVMSLIDENADAEVYKRVMRFADGLGVRPDELNNLRQLVEGQTLSLRFDVARRVWFMDRLKKAWSEGGFRWLARTLATLKLADNAPVAEKYRALGEYPEGTLGRCYFDHMREQGFPLAGEKGSQVEAVFIHDLTHLVAGYGTDARGEVLTASFSAGNRRQDPFTYIFFVVCQFHLGMRFSPFAPSETGAFDAQDALWAAKRGMEVNVDLSEDWDYWPDLALSLDDVRAKLGISMAHPPNGSAEN